MSYNLDLLIDDTGLLALTQQSHTCKTDYQLEVDYVSKA